MPAAAARTYSRSRLLSIFPFNENRKIIQSSRKARGHVESTHIDGWGAVAEGENAYMLHALFNTQNMRVTAHAARERVYVYSNLYVCHMQCVFVQKDVVKCTLYISRV